MPYQLRKTLSRIEFIQKKVNSFSPTGRENVLELINFLALQRSRISFELLEDDYEKISNLINQDTVIRPSYEGGLHQVIEQTHNYLDNVFSSYSRLQKIECAKRLFDYLVVNKNFVLSNSYFNKIVLKKLLEFIVNEGLIDFIKYFEHFLLDFNFIKRNLPKPEECPICYLSFKNENNISLICGHWFHSSCLDEWKKFDNCCPMCRTII